MSFHTKNNTIYGKIHSIRNGHRGRFSLIQWLTNSKTIHVDNMTIFFVKRGFPVDSGLRLFFFLTQDQCRKFNPFRKYTESFNGKIESEVVVLFRESIHVNSEMKSTACDKCTNQKKKVLLNFYRNFPDPNWDKNKLDKNFTK